MTWKHALPGIILDFNSPWFFIQSGQFSPFPFGGWKPEHRSVPTSVSMLNISLPHLNKILNFFILLKTLKLHPWQIYFVQYMTNFTFNLNDGFNPLPVLLYVQAFECTMNEKQYTCKSLMKNHVAASHQKRESAERQLSTVWITLTILFGIMCSWLIPSIIISINTCSTSQSILGRHSIKTWSPVGW